MSERIGFEAFVQARSDRLLRAAYLLTRDRTLAEDLVQTALTKVWLAWSRIDDPDAYVWRTLTTTYTSWWRRKWHGELPTEQLPDSRSTPGADAAIGSSDLWNALGRLPRRQRAAVVLRFYLDFSEAQTADVMECSVGTVKSQTSKALAKLRIDPTIQPDGVPRPEPVLPGGDFA